MGTGDSKTAQNRARAGILEPAQAFSTRFGSLYRGRIEKFFESRAGRQLRGRVQLILTSPPFPLNEKKSYGNLSGLKYVEWIAGLAKPLSDLIRQDGSIVIEIGNAWEPGRPVQSVLHLKALLALLEAPDAGLRLCQEFICYNPARIPSPAQWVTVERQRVVDSFTHVWWLAKSDRPKADNRRVLRPYSSDMKELLRTRKFNVSTRPSEHKVRAGAFRRDNGGSIAHNVFELEAIDPRREVRLPNALSFANTASTDRFTRACRAAGRKPHPARMPLGLARFFIEFLTERSDLVLDPFAGTNTTGYAAEESGRRWVGVEVNWEYAKQACLRMGLLGGSNGYHNENRDVRSVRKKRSG
jgi:site-specific DNA-methyltransferase (cytosine-N4-specific)